MKRMGIIGLSIASILAFGAIFIASASATEVLFSSATGTFKATGGKVEFNGASTIPCNTSSTSGTIETAHLGKIKMTLEKCATQLLGTHECTGTKPASGVKGNIIIEVPFHLGTARKISTETAHSAILLLFTPALEYECAGVGKVKVSGNLIGLLQTKAGAALEPPEELLKSVLAFQGSGKTQSHKEFLLSLVSEELMTKQELETEIFGIKGETSLIASSEFTEITPTGAHLISG